jgi:hypothetical protein
MSTDPFDSVTPEVAELLSAAKQSVPAAENPALFAAMADAVVTGRLIPQAPSSRRRSMIGKVLTAKAAAIAGVLVLSGGVAAAATGTLPDPVQNTASDAAEHVGIHLPQGDHGAAVSDAAHDKSGTEDGSNHGKDVSTVARDNHGHNKDTTTTTVVGDDNSGPGNSNGAGKSEDSHSSDVSRDKGSNGSDDPADHDAGDDNGDDDSVTTTTVTGPAASHSGDDSVDHPSGDDNPGSQSGKGKGGKGSDD